MTTDFSLRKPIYLVFHDKGERYYLDSMLCLNLDQYLSLLLRKDGYRSIFYLDVSANEQITVRAANYPSFCRNQIPGKLLQKSLWQTDPVPEKYPHVVYRNAYSKNLMDWLLGCLAESGTAVIADIASVNALLRKMDDKVRQRLMSFLTDIRRSGTLIVTGPMELDKKLHEEYTGEGSILMYAGGMFFGDDSSEAVFPQFHMAVKDGSTDVFSVLKNHYEHQVLELGAMDTEDVHGVLVHAAFSLETYLPETALRDYASYIVYWLRSPELRRDARMLLDGESFSTRTELYQFLVSDQFESVRAGAAEQRAWYMNQGFADAAVIPMDELLKLRYGDLTSISFAAGTSICINDAVLKKAFRILPDGSGLFDNQEQSEFNIIMPSEGDWLQMLKHAVTPASTWPRQERIGKINELLGIYETAFKKKDIDTQKRTVNVLSFCITNLYAVNNKKYEQYCKTCDAYLTTSQCFCDSQKELLVLQNQLQMSDSAGYSNALLRAKADSTGKRIGIYRKLLNDCDITLRQMASINELSFSENMRILQNYVKKHDDELTRAIQSEQPDPEPVPQVVSDFRGIQPNQDWY